MGQQVNIKIKIDDNLKDVSIDAESLGLDSTLKCNALKRDSISLLS